MEQHKPVDLCLYAVEGCCKLGTPDVTVGSSGAHRSCASMGRGRGVVLLKYLSQYIEYIMTFVGVSSSTCNGWKEKKCIDFFWYHAIV